MADTNNPQPHFTQNFIPPDILFNLPVMETPVQFDHQPRLVTVKINDEPRDDLPLAPPARGRCGAVQV